MSEIQTNPETKEQLITLENLTSSEARNVLNAFCETHPEIAELTEHEARKTVEIAGDFTLDNVDNPDWTCVYDAVLLNAVIRNSVEYPSALIDTYRPEHAVLTFGLLNDVETLEDKLSELRNGDPLVKNKLESGLQSNYRKTQTAFSEKFDFADARTVDRKVEGLCPQAEIAYASGLLYRLNRTRNYRDVDALKDIIDAQTVFVPLFKLGYDAFSSALDEASEGARLDRAGRLAELDVAKQMLGEMFGANPEKKHREVLKKLFGGAFATHKTESGDDAEGLSIRSVVGHASGEHSVYFYVLHGNLAGVTDFKIIYRQKGEASLMRKLKHKEYEGVDLNDPETWPRDMFAGTVIVGKKKEDEYDKVDMEAEERNVNWATQILKALVTYISLDSTPELIPQATPARKGKWVHIRGDKLYTDKVQRDSGIDSRLIDLVINNDHNFQVSKPTFSADGVNNELQIETRRARYNARVDEGSHWLFKIEEAIKSKLAQRSLGDLKVGKYDDILGPNRRSISTAYLKKLRLWLRTKVTDNYRTILGADDYCKKHRLGSDLV